MERKPQYTVGELAELAGVSRRTVRYYVQENLIDPPFGAGRGSYYGGEHLSQILRVKSLQEEGRSLIEVKRVLAGKEPSPPTPRPLPRGLWTRIALGPGVELHVSSERRIPPPGGLRELAETIRRYFPLEAHREDSND